MKSFSARLLLIALLVVLAVSDQPSKKFPQPDPSWDDYKFKSCCPEKFIQVNNYCVNCKAPNVFDIFTQKCTPCPKDKVYNNETKQCDCKAPCELPRMLNASNICDCPLDQKATKMIWNEKDKTCNCPVKLPLWNGKYCVGCPPKTEFDPKEHQCYHCPDGFIRDYSSHACVPQL